MMKNIERGVEYTIFWSRWLQAPIYLGLVVAQILYCYKFAKEVIGLILMADSSTETRFLLAVLTLIDIAMVANLITMVVIGGYATFVSKLDIDENADKPEWLSHIDPGAIKVKLSGSLVGISSVHLLKTFIYIGNPDPSLLVDHDSLHPEVVTAAARTLSNNDIMWQIIIHMTFVVSTILLALTEFVMHRRYRPEAAHSRNLDDRNA